MDGLVSRLCRDCALCCDGTFFARVPLGEGEVAAPGMTVVEGQAGGRYVPQPCGALEGNACSRYAERPAACRRYQCLLAGALAGGEVSLREAIKAISRARDYAAEADEAAREDYFTFTFGRR